jgi:type IV secretion system protein VirB1
MADFVAPDNECLRYAQAPIAQAMTFVESTFNPYAIGVVGGALVRQPRNKPEAVATALALKAAGWNYSMGCRQVNQSNLAKYGLDHNSVFDPRQNAMAGSAIYDECRTRAVAKFGEGDSSTRAALSCYYSGNFTRGQQKEGNKASYVDKVLASLPSGSTPQVGLAIPVVPKGKSKRQPEGKHTSTGAADFRGGENVATTQPAEAKRPSWDVFNEL